MRWLGLLVLCVTTTAHAELTKDQVRKTIKANLRSIIACYETTPPPNTSRQIIVTFTVAPSGKVTKSIGTNNPPVDDCVATAIKQMKFPASPSATEVRYPFWIDGAGS